MLPGNYVRTSVLRSARLQRYDLFFTVTKNNVTYEPGRGWRFEYDHITEVDSLKIFLRDLRVVTRITALGNGVESGTFPPRCNDRVSSVPFDHRLLLGQCLEIPQSTSI